jgi:hypothetical protein
MMAWPDSIVFPGGLAPVSAGQLVINAEDCCCEPPAPCACPDGMPAALRLAGYTDGDLAPCVGCADASLWDPIPHPVWDGAFTWHPADCTWGDGPAGPWFIIDGKQLRAATIWLDEAACKWRLTIECELADTWIGEKITGVTPVGLYSRTSGCDLTPTLEIEEVP